MNAILRLFNKTFARVPHIKDQVVKINKRLVEDEVFDLYTLGNNMIIQSKLQD